MRWVSLRGRVFVHATEDEPRVREAFLWVLGLLGEKDAEHRVDRNRAKGHWGNEILILEATLKKQAEIERCLGLLLHDPEARRDVSLRLGRHMDEDGVLHLRLDKQAAVRQAVAFTTGSDAIVVQVKPEHFAPNADLGADWLAYLGGARAG
jgi:RNA binding exosome subunit